MLKKAKKLFFPRSKTKDTGPIVAPLGLTPSIQKSSRRDLEEETPFGPARSAKSNDSFGSERGLKKHSKGRSDSQEDLTLPLYRQTNRPDSLKCEKKTTTMREELGLEDTVQSLMDRRVQDSEKIMVLDVEGTKDSDESTLVENRLDDFKTPTLSDTWVTEGIPLIDSSLTLVTSIEQPRDDSTMIVESAPNSPVLITKARDATSSETESSPILMPGTLDFESSPKESSSMKDTRLDQLVEQTLVSPKLVIPPLPLKSIDRLVVEDVEDAELNLCSQPDLLLLESGEAGVDEEETLLRVELDVPEANLRVELAMPSILSSSEDDDELHQQASRAEEVDAKYVNPLLHSEDSVPNLQISLDPSSVLEPKHVFVVSPGQQTNSLHDATSVSGEVSNTVESIGGCVHSSETPEVSALESLNHLDALLLESNLTKGAVESITPTERPNENATLEQQTTGLPSDSSSCSGAPALEYRRDYDADVDNVEQRGDGEQDLASSKHEFIPGPTDEPSRVEVSGKLEKVPFSNNLECAAASITAECIGGEKALQDARNASTHANILEEFRDRFATNIEYRMYDKRFASAVCSCPVIGDRHSFLSISAETQKKVNDELTNKACLLDDTIDLRHSVLKTYLQEASICTAVNTAQFAKDYARQELATFTRVLHDTLMNPPESIRRWTNKCWRWLESPQECRNSMLVTFPSFISATRDGSKVWRQLSSYVGSSTLAVFTQDPGQGPVDVSRFSKAPNDFEVIYSLGQQFRVVQTEEWSFLDLQRELGTEYAFDDGQFPKSVIHLAATDAFYEFASDLYRAGGPKDQAVPVLEARLSYERNFGDEPHRALLYLGRAKREIGDLEAAENCMRDALHIRKQRGIVETRDGSGLLMSLGMVKFDQGFFEEAVYYYSEARAVLARTDDLWSAGAATLMASLGTAKRVLADLDGALAALQNAAEIHRHLGTLISPTGAALMASIARTYHDMQEYEKALEAYVQSKRLAEVTGSLWTANGGVLMTSIGTILRTMGDCASALKAYEKARSILIKTGTLETPGGAALLTSIGTSRHASQNIIGGFVAHKEATALHHKLGLDDVPFGLFAWEQLQAVTDDCSANGCLDEAMAAWEDYCVRGDSAWQDYMVPQAFSIPSSPISAIGNSPCAPRKPSPHSVKQEPKRVDEHKMKPRAFQASADLGHLDKYAHLYGGESSEDEETVEAESNVSV